MALAERVTRRMRAKGRVGRTVTLRLRFGDYTRASRSRTLAQPTAGSDAVIGVVRRLLADARPEIDRRGLTLLGLTLSNLDGEDTGQLALPLDDGSPRARGHARPGLRALRQGQDDPRAAARPGPRRARVRRPLGGSSTPSEQRIEV